MINLKLLQIAEQSERMQIAGLVARLGVESP
jgi:hypothetical protein